MLLMLLIFGSFHSVLFISGDRIIIKKNNQWFSECILITAFVLLLHLTKIQIAYDCTVCGRKSLKVEERENEKRGSSHHKIDHSDQDCDPPPLRADSISTNSLSFSLFLSLPLPLCLSLSFYFSILALSISFHLKMAL